MGVHKPHNDCLFLVIAMLVMASNSLCGCGGGGTAGGSVNTSASAPSPLSGNWQITTMSNTQVPANTPYGAYITQNGESLSGNFSHADGTGVTGTVSGTASANSLSLALQDPSGLDIQVTATSTAGTAGVGGSFYGTYTDAPKGDQGTISGTQVASLVGTWSGTVTSSVSHTSSSITTTLSEKGVDTTGFPNLAGTLSFSGTPCFTNGTLTGDQRGAFIGGPGISGLTQVGYAVIQTDDGIILVLNSEGEYTQENSAGNTITLNYEVLSGACGGDFGTGVLNK